jgi:hypothetical protein
MAGVSFVLAGCALNFFGAERRAAWRDQEERACMASRQVDTSRFIQKVSKVDGRGACGISKPLKVAAMSDGRVSIGPVATLNCPMTAAVDAWLAESVQPAALAWFGMPVIEINQISDYSCRPKNNQRGESLSEHSFGNALDVAGFKLADGRTVTVKANWRKPAEAKGFLHEVFATACQRFKTVLGPGVKYHGDHFHLDLAHHGEAGTRHYCRPTPDVNPPRRPPAGGALIARGSNRGLLDRIFTGSLANSAPDYSSAYPSQPGRGPSAALGAPMGYAEGE